MARQDLDGFLVAAGAFPPLLSNNVCAYVQHDLAGELEVAFDDILQKGVLQVSVLVKILKRRSHFGDATFELVEASAKHRFVHDQSGPPEAWQTWLHPACRTCNDSPDSDDTFQP